MRSLARILAGFLVPVAMLTGCGGENERERFLITDTAPFYETALPCNQGCADAVVAAVESFADRENMDFLLAREALGPGEFNASANGPTLNLIALHIDTFGPVISIYAIARGEPTDEHRSLVQDFVSEISRASEPAVPISEPS